MNNEGTIALPHSAEAEEAVIGSLLLNPRLMPELLNRIDESQFFLLKNARWFAAMKALYERQTGIDMLTFTEELKRRGEWEESIDAPRLHFIQYNMPSSLHAPIYADIVHRCAVRRETIKIGAQIMQEGYKENLEIDEMLANGHSLIMNVIAAEGKAFGSTAKELANADYAEWERRQAQGGGMLGLSSGSDELDRLIGGLQPDRTTFIGGRPKMGKTAAQLMILLNVALDLQKAPDGEWVYLYSLEMSKADITRRLIAQLSGINLSKLSLGNLTSAESSAYTTAVATLSNLRLFIDDKAGLSIKDISDRMTVNVLRYGPPALIAVDYVQILRGGRSSVYHSDSRPVEVEDAAYGLSELAKTYHCHIISGAQVKQEVEMRNDKRAGASDLGNSDGVLRAADHVITLFRESVYKSAASESLEWILVANRHGETGKISDLQWNRSTASMINKKKAAQPLLLGGYDD